MANMPYLMTKHGSRDSQENLFFPEGAKVIKPARKQNEEFDSREAKGSRKLFVFVIPQSDL